MSRVLDQRDLPEPWPQVSVPIFDDTAVEVLIEAAAVGEVPMRVPSVRVVGGTADGGQIHGVQTVVIAKGGGRRMREAFG